MLRDSSLGARRRQSSQRVMVPSDSSETRRPLFPNSRYFMVITSGIRHCRGPQPSGYSFIWIRFQRFAIRNFQNVQPPSVSVVLEEFLYFVRGHAAGTRGSDGLAVAAVLHVAAGENPRHFREDIVMRHQISIRVGFKLTSYDLRVQG